jgi:dihydroorotate dehydrogenase
VPLIGAGGIHSLQDARDYLEAGAVAVQIDSVTWVQPRLLERIARDLSGGLVTRASDAYPDEWHPDMGDTEFRELFSDDE